MAGRQIEERQRSNIDEKKAVNKREKKVRYNSSLFSKFGAKLDKDVQEGIKKDEGGREDRKEGEG